MTSVIMLWYLLTSQSDWLGNVVANCMPMASTHRHRAVKRHLTVVVEVNRTVSSQFCAVFMGAAKS